MDAKILDVLKKVSEDYDINGDLINYTKYTNGHINDTYQVDFSNCSHLRKSYIFQRINDYVFKEPAKVMSNIKVITQYWKAIENKPDCDIIAFMDTKDGKNYTYCDEDGYWRVCDCVENSVSYETAEDLKVLRSAGYAFGQFQHVLSDFPMDKLYDTIPDFHNTKKRLNQLFHVVSLDPLNRAKEVRTEIEFFQENAGIASKLVEMQEKGKLPLRVTHNDTKYNNILMDKNTCEPLCVIDLDTVMPGLSMHDYGDAIRFAANKAQEDERDLLKAGLDKVKFEEFTKGFISASKEFLTKNEFDNMVLGAIAITIELASRFLADHINGDKYFRVHRKDHNLDRARCQIALAKDMIAKHDEMCSVVMECSV